MFKPSWRGRDTPGRNGDDDEVTSSDPDADRPTDTPTGPVARPPLQVPGAGVESGEPGLVPGLSLTDTEDVDQITAIPPMPGLSFRGRGPDWWETDVTYREPRWLRTSRDPLVGSENFARGGVVAVFGPCGRDIAGLTDHAAEQETVFLPGSRFTVLRRGEFEGLWVDVVYVHRDDEEPDSPAPGYDVESEVARAAAVIARARQLPAATIDRPGRFTGEFGERGGERQ